MTYESVGWSKRGIERRPGAPAVRSRTLFEILSIALALGFVAFGALETQPSWLESLRLLLSLGAIAFVCFAPCRSFFKRAVLVVAVEAFGGIVIFGIVDVPVVIGHRTQIVAVAASLQDSIAQFQRRAGFPHP